MFQKLLYENYLLLFEIIGLLIILFISAHVTPRIKKYTRIAIALLILSCLVHNIELWVQGIPYATFWRAFLTSCKYVLYPLMVTSLIPIMCPFKSLNNTKGKIILFAPLVICSILYFTSYSTHLVFYIEVMDDGMTVFSGGPLRYLPYVCFVGYFIFYVVQILIYLKNYSLKNRLIFIYIVIGSFLAVLVYRICGNNDNFNGIFTASLLLFFLLYYILRSSIDPLTGLLNRQAYYQEMQQHAHHINYIVSIDMNNLKYINDTYGHEKGDVALKTISKIFSTYSGQHSLVFRIGGDEFIIFYTKVAEEDVLKNIENMTNKLKETEYSCAFGYTKKGPLDDFQASIREADYYMYKNKRKMKNEEKNNEK